MASPDIASMKTRKSPPHCAACAGSAKKSERQNSVIQCLKSSPFQPYRDMSNTRQARFRYAASQGRVESITCWLTIIFAGVARRRLSILRHNRAGRCGSLTETIFKNTLNLYREIHGNPLRRLSALRGAPKLQTKLNVRIPVLLVGW